MKTTSNLKISKITFRSGMINNMKAKSSCKEYVFTGDEISPEVRKIFNSDKIAELAGEWGDPDLGSPIQYQWARAELDNGQSCEIEVRNLAVMIFHSNDEKIKRLFRFIVRLEKHARSHA
jgi:hypothetical protein